MIEKNVQQIVMENNIYVILLNLIIFKLIFIFLDILKSLNLSVTNLRYEIRDLATKFNRIEQGQLM
jgi:hypothetical protein